VPSPCRASSPATGCAPKDSDKYLLLGDACTRAGLALARFDFRGSGESEGLSEAETTVGSRVDDVLVAVTFLRGHARLDGVVGLLGSSMGGFVALHARCALPEPIPVVTWNAPASLAKLAATIPLEDTGLGVPFATEFAAGRYALAPVGIDHHLVIQSEADETVAVQHGITLHSSAAEPRALVIIPDADHRITNPTHRRQAITESLAWFHQHLPAHVHASR
jgi:alpha-beta hydrolase superfamily lysophospholipase